MLEGADVAALAADDAALHVVGGELDDGHGRLGRVAGGEALHDDGEDVADAAVGVALGLLLDLADEAGGIVADLVLELLEQELLGLGRGEPGDALELADVALVGLVGLQHVLLELLGAGVELRRSARRAPPRASVRRSSRRPISCAAGEASSVSAAAAAACLVWVARGVADGAFPAATSPGARLTSSSAATTRPAARTAAAITISIVRVLSPYAALLGAARSDASFFGGGRSGPARGPEREDQHQGGAAAPPRQMAAT